MLIKPYDREKVLTLSRGIVQILIWSLRLVSERFPWCPWQFLSGWGQSSSVTFHF